MDRLKSGRTIRQVLSKEAKGAPQMETKIVIINNYHLPPEKKGFSFQGFLSLVGSFIRFITWL